MKYIEGVDGIFAASIERADPRPPRPRAPVRVVSAKPRPRVSQARWLGTLLQMARGVDDGASDIEFEAGRAFN